MKSAFTHWANLEAARDDLSNPFQIQIIELVEDQEKFTQNKNSVICHLIPLALYFVLFRAGLAGRCEGGGVGNQGGISTKGLVLGVSCGGIWTHVFDELIGSFRANRYLAIVANRFI